MSKTAFLLSGALLSLSACALEAQPNYTVTYPVGADANNTMAYLMNWDSAEKVDSVVVSDGVVKFEGHIEAPMIGRLMVNGKRGPIFIVENGNIEISQDGNSAGTPLNDKFTASKKRMSDIVKEFNSLDRNDSIQAVKAKGLLNEYESLPSKTYADNKDNLLGLYMYMQGAYELPLSQVDADMASNPVLANSKQLQALRNTLAVQAETGVGKHYKDFTVEYNGKKEAFSSYVKPGRYTIVDFWASWCGPCVRQLKVIKELYAKYKDKGLDVVGVAVWDKPEDTEKAIKSHELPWPCIINAQTIPTDLYGIQGIPCILLINPDGIIVSRDKQGADLVKDVDDAMATYKAPEASADAKSVPMATIQPADTVAAF